VVEAVVLIGCIVVFTDRGVAGVLKVDVPRGAPVAEAEVLIG
jgi:hypothetical protein